MTDAELIGRLNAIVGRAGTPDDEILRAVLVRLVELARAAPPAFGPRPDRGRGGRRRGMGRVRPERLG